MTSTVQQQVETQIRRVAPYLRVSTEDQRDRATIRTQEEAVGRALRGRDDVQLVEMFRDDGVSGMLAFGARPGGAALLAAARQGSINEVWTYRYDRLARDEIESLLIRRDLEALGIKIYSICEGYTGDLLYGIQAVLSGEERRKFLARSKEGAERAAREGRPLGGVIAYGYQVQGRKNNARLQPQEEILPGQIMSEAGVVRHIYERLAVFGLSCGAVADELNALAIPTKYVLEGRGVRGRRTQGRWGAGRIRNMVTNPTYKGNLSYGKRSAKPREVITAPCPALVSEETWQQAQETLSRNRSTPKNTKHIYLLRGVMRCASCGRTLCGTQAHRGGYYRCDGTLRRSELVGERCRTKSVNARLLEEPVWNDIEAYLRNPGDILERLAEESKDHPAEQALAAERKRWEAALAEWQGRRARIIDSYELGVINRGELEERLARVKEGLGQAEVRLAELTEAEEPEAESLNPDLLVEIRRRLDEGLSDEERSEIVRLLVKRITIVNETDDEGRESRRAHVAYRFYLPSATCRDNPSSLNYTIWHRNIELPTGRQKQAGP